MSRTRKENPTTDLTKTLKLTTTEWSVATLAFRRHSKLSNVPQTYWSSSFQLRPKEVLEKYDEEIQGKKKEKFELGKFNCFKFTVHVMRVSVMLCGVVGSGGKYNAEHERRMMEIKHELQQRGVS